MSEIRQPQYAQGPVSIEFKAVLKEKIQAATTDTKMDDLLNEIHDMTLVCRNDPDGLQAAVSFLRNEAAE